MGHYLGAGLEPNSGWDFGFRAEFLVDVRTIGYSLSEHMRTRHSAQLNGTLDRGDRTMRTVRMEVPVPLAILRWPLPRLDLRGGVAHLMNTQQRVVGYRNDNGREEPLDERIDRTDQPARGEVALIAGAEVDSGHRLDWGPFMERAHESRSRKGRNQQHGLDVATLLGQYALCNAGPIVIHSLISAPEFDQHCEISVE